MSLGCDCVFAKELRVVRVTFYDGESCHGARTSTGTITREGTTVAVDPRTIPYGSTIEIGQLKGVIGDGRFVAEDTGTAVVSRKAAKAQARNVPVIDVYVRTKKRVRYLEKTM